MHACTTTVVVQYDSAAHDMHDEDEPRIEAIDIHIAEESPFVGTTAR